MPPKLNFVLAYDRSFGNEYEFLHKHKHKFVFVRHKHKKSFGIAPLYYLGTIDRGIRDTGG